MFRRFLVFVLLSCLMGGALLRAQSYTHLFGLIRDPSDAAMPDATVTVVSEETGFRRVTHSRSDGSYVVASLEPDLYTITVRKAGFRTMIHLGVRLQVAQPVRVDFTLTLGPNFCHLEQKWCGNVAAAARLPVPARERHPISAHRSGVPRVQQRLRHS